MIKTPLISSSNIRICVVGLGYVGFPLAIEFGKKYETIGFDINKRRIKELKEGFDRTLEISNFNLKDIKSLELTSNERRIASSNIYIITVPTPIYENKTPNLEPIESASNLVGEYLGINNLVIYESTVYPGATEQICVPILQKRSSLKYNKTFFCGYSPERVNPGDNKHTLVKIKKVISGSNDKALELVDFLYSSIIKAGTVKVSSIAIAEASKVIENTQRDLNIALMNELSIIFNKLNLNTSEILNAAETKWNFLPFKPGLVGGHCIGVDPYYLTHKAMEVGYKPEVILSGRKINDGMGKYIVNVTLAKLKKINILPANSKIGVFGLTFKENCPDFRNTKVVDIINNLKEKNCDLVGVDPYCVNKEHLGITIKTIEEVQNLDCIILAVSHSEFKNISLNKWKLILSKKSIFIDVKSVYNNKKFQDSFIEYWSL